MKTAWRYNKDERMKPKAPTRYYEPRDLLPPIEGLPEPTEKQIARRRRVASQNEKRGTSVEAQIREKLIGYYAHRIEQYQWLDTGDSCPLCQYRATHGPYSIYDALAGYAPIPGRNSHEGCRCSISTVL